MPSELVNTGPNKPNICTVLISEAPKGVWVRDHGPVSSSPLHKLEIRKDVKQGSDLLMATQL